MKANDLIAVLLLNLGGPDSLEAVRPFLFNLFSDREIIRLGPQFMQKPLAALISAVRHKKTEGYYRLIGGKSPILDITEAQARALEQELNNQLGVRLQASEAEKPSSLTSRRLPYRVFIGMRYWHPLIEDIVREIHEEGIRKIVALGLYPHYSIATTGSSLSKLKEVASRFSGDPFEIFTVLSWQDHPRYIDALVEKIQKGIDAFRPSRRRGDVHLLFSAHSLPEKFIEEGDPYVEHIRTTIGEIGKRIEIEWDLSYQSKSGPVKWLSPSTDEMIGTLSGRGVKKLLVVPISFVSDHIETLYEIDILYKKLAASHGMRLERTESLNTSPLFISALADIVRKGMKEAGWA
ncbi:MAG: ferrochelatase [Nitrospiraceae bacterium]|nr:ferrochelatase [Nitrospiraceae bacterium]